MFKQLILIFNFFSFLSFASEYKISLPEIQIPQNAILEITSINDNGSFLGRYMQRSSQNKIYIFDNKKGLSFIESENQSFYPITMNNIGQVLGNGNNNKPFIWSKTLGIKWLDIFNSSDVKACCLNDLGQIIGSYQPIGSNSEKRPFLWDYGTVIDMGPGSDFSKQLEILGWHVMEIQLTSINNKGELTGYFAFGKFNEKKKKYVVIGYECFYWDGELHIISLPEKMKQPPQVLKVNNSNSIMISYGNDRTYLWSLQEGSKIIENFIGFAFNDSTTLLGQSIINDKFCYAIWKEGKIESLENLLGVSSIDQIAPLYSDNYAVESLRVILCINKKGQIPCLGLIWGDQYPCILDPIKKQENLEISLNEFMEEYNKSKENNKISPLHYAIRHHYNDLIPHLINNCVKSKSNKTDYFLCAVENGNVDALLHMIDAKWDILAQNNSFLHEAAKNGHPNMCQELINLGFDPNGIDINNKNTPLYECAISSVNAKNDLEKMSSTGVARILLYNGANPNQQNKFNCFPLISVCGGKYNAPFVKLLLAAGANPNLSNDTDETALTRIICNTEKAKINNIERIAIVNELLEHGANPNHFCHARFYGNFPELHVYNYKIPPIVGAICSNDSSIVEMLIKYGADINSPVRANQYGTMYPIDYAIKWNRKSIIEILNRHGARKNS